MSLGNASTDRTAAAGRSTATFGTITVSDLMLLVAFSSVSILLMRWLLPATPTTQDYVFVTCYCAPVGLAVFGPWAVRRQFVDGVRDELESGEWIWIALAGFWLAATPLLLVTRGQGLAVLTGVMAGVGLIVGLLALIESITGTRRRPWTHWAGVLLCLLHAVPAIVQIGPFLWDWIETTASSLSDSLLK